MANTKVISLGGVVIVLGAAYLGLVYQEGKVFDQEVKHFESQVNTMAKGEFLRVNVSNPHFFGRDVSIDVYDGQKLALQWKGSTSFGLNINTQLSLDPKSPLLAELQRGLQQPVEVKDQVRFTSSVFSKDLAIDWTLNPIDINEPSGHMQIGKLTWKSVVNTDTNLVTKSDLTLDKLSMETPSKEKIASGPISLKSTDTTLTLTAKDLLARQGPQIASLADFTFNSKIKFLDKNKENARLETVTSANELDYLGKKLLTNVQVNLDTDLNAPALQAYYLKQLTEGLNAVQDPDAVTEAMNKIFKNIDLSAEIANGKDKSTGQLKIAALSPIVMEGGYKINPDTFKAMPQIAVLVNGLIAQTNGVMDDKGMGVLTFKFNEKTGEMRFNEKAAK